MNRRFNRYFWKLLRKHRGLTSKALLTLAAVSALLNYKGLEPLVDEGGADWQNRAVAAFVALTVGKLVHLIWTHALDMTPFMPTLRGRKGAMVLTGVFCVFLLAMSSYLNVIALTGPAALEVHALRTLSAFEQALGASYGQAKEIEELAGDLSLEGERFTRLAQSERESGTLTGVPGPGTVADAAEDVGEEFHAMVRELFAHTEGLEAGEQNNRARLEAMRLIMSGGQPAHERLGAFAREANALRAGLIDMASGNPAAGIERKLLALPDTIGSRALSGRSRGVASAQESALAGLRHNVSASAARLAPAAKEIAAMPQVPVPAFERLSVAKAVFIYGDNFVPQIAAAVAIDLCPLLLVLFVMLGFTQATSGKHSDLRARLEELSAQELLDAFEVLALIRQSTEQPRRIEDRRDDKEEDDDPWNSKE